MNWKILLLPLAAVVEVASFALVRRECGFGNWVMDRKLGDRAGRPWQTRRQANPDASR